MMAELAAQEEGTQIAIGKAKFNEFARALLIITVLLYVLTYLFTSYVLAILATAVLVYVAFARLSFRKELASTRLTTTRHAKARAFQDRTFPAELEIRNNSQRAARILIEDIVPDGLELASGSVTIEEVIEPGMSKGLSYHLRPTTRGRVLLDRYKLRVFGGRGLMEAAAESSCPYKIEVEPPIQRFREGEILRRREYIAKAGSTPTSSIRPGRGYGFDGLRGYLPDDGFGTIEWKASSRLAKLMTKMMHDESRDTVYIFLDSSTPMRTVKKSGEESKLDRSVEVVVQLATLLTRQGFPVGLGAYDEGKMVVFEPPGQKQMGPVRLLDTISMIPKSRVTGSVVQEGSPTRGGVLTRVLPFLGGRRTATSPRTTGIYEVVRRLVSDRVKSGMVIIFSDLETNQNSMTLTCRIITQRGHHPIIVMPPAPPTDMKRRDAETRSPGKRTAGEEAREGLARKLESMGVQIVELGRQRFPVLAISHRLSRR